MAIVAMLALSGCGGSSRDHATSSCAAVDHGVLPEWARTGFSDPEPKIAHVIGDSGRIAAILFGEPLLAPPAKDRSNKILWVSKDPQVAMSDLKIRAVSGDQVLNRTVPGGPGPSTVDLPAGCWKLTLTWSGRNDTLNLQYR